EPAHRITLSVSEGTGLAVGQDDILRPVVNRPVADAQPCSKSSDAIGAQDANLPHNFSQGYPGAQGLDTNHAAWVKLLGSGIQTDSGKRLEMSMSLRINDEAPNFTAETTQGAINFHEWIGDGWAVLFSHPKDFTPVCTTELGYMAGLEPEFKKRNTKIIGLSVDPVSSHKKWAADIEETQGHKVNYPMIGDPELKIAKLYGMLPAESGSTSEGRTPADNAAVRTVFIVGPDKKIKLMLSYPMSTGRNFDEVVRVLDSIQLTAKHKVATPVNWKRGEDVIIAGSVSD